MATLGTSPADDGGIEGLLDSSPDPGVHTSAAAETGFLLGLVALLAAPFSVMHGLSLATAATGAALALVGVVRTSNPYVAGRALAPFGLLLAVAALILVGLRYLGVETAFGDELLPTFADWLENLNERMPRP